MESRHSCCLVLFFILTHCTQALPVIPDEPSLSPVDSFSKITIAVIPLLTSRKPSDIDQHKTALWSQRLMGRPKGTTDLVATQVVISELRAIGFKVLNLESTAPLSTIRSKADVVFSGNTDVVYMGYYRSQPYLEGHFKLVLKASSAGSGDLLWQKSGEGKALVLNEEKNKEMLIRRATRNGIRKLMSMHLPEMEHFLTPK